MYRSLVMIIVNSNERMKEDPTNTYLIYLSYIYLIPHLINYIN